MSIHYLEIVTDDQESTCAVYENSHGVTFSSEPLLGNARIAPMKNGGLIGVRLPMSDTEQPAVRPYHLVEDIEKAYQMALDSGAQEAHSPLNIPGIGTFAIYEVGGNQLGLWQK